MLASVLCMEDNTVNNLRVLILGFSLMAAALPVSADIVEGRTANGRAYVSGGIGLEESERMKQMADAYPLQLLVTSRAGAYLADALVTVVDANGQKILALTLDAPWLLVDLAPGGYQISVTSAGRVQQRNLRLVSGKHERVVIQFDVPADTAKNPAFPVK
ncbi:MAG: hypothetical protein ABJA83_10460 [Burkholderiaceae bacterium]